MPIPTLKEITDAREERVEEQATYEIDNLVCEQLIKNFMPGARQVIHIPIRRWDVLLKICEKLQAKGWQAQPFEAEDQQGILVQDYPFEPIQTI